PLSAPMLYSVVMNPVALPPGRAKLFASRTTAARSYSASKVGIAYSNSRRRNFDDRWRGRRRGPDNAVSRTQPLGPPLPVSSFKWVTLASEAILAITNALDAWQRIEGKLPRFLGIFPHCNSKFVDESPAKPATDNQQQESDTGAGSFTKLHRRIVKCG